MKNVVVILALMLSAALPYSTQAQDDKAQAEQNKSLQDKKKLESEQLRLQEEQRKLDGEQRKILDQKRKLASEQRKLQSEQRKIMLDDSKAQEIVIRKKGDKGAPVTVVVDGDNITVNGKPMSEFKDDDVTVSKRNIIVRNGSRMGLTYSGNDMFDSYSFFNPGDGKTRAFLGVNTTDDDAGARITEVTKESAAEKAGLQSGDIITKIDDKKIENPEDLMDVIGDKKPKDEVTVYYKRDGKDGSLKATLGERKEPATMAYSLTTPDGISRSYTIPRVNVKPDIEIFNGPELKSLGSTSPLNWSYGDGNGFGNIFYNSRPRLGIKIQDTEEEKGVKILDVDKDSPAEKAGLKKDDIVTEIAGTKVNNTDEAREQLQESSEKNAYTIKAKRDGKEMSFDIKIPKPLKTANL